MPRAVVELVVVLKFLKPVVYAMYMFKMSNKISSTPFQVLKAPVNLRGFFSECLTCCGFFSYRLFEAVEINRKREKRLRAKFRNTFFSSLTSREASSSSHLDFPKSEREKDRLNCVFFCSETALAHKKRFWKE